MNELAQDDVLLQEFLTESEELLQRIEQDLLGLESSGDPEILHRVFRGMHTIKGTSSFLGFDQLVLLTHQTEDLLNLLRKDELKTTPVVIDVLLSVADEVKVMLADIRARKSPEYDLSPWLDKIALIRSGGQAATPAQAPQQSAEAPVPSEPEASPIAPDVVVSAEQPLPAPASEPAAATRQQPPAAPHASRQGDIEASSTMRVDVRKLDYLINLVGELVLERNRLVQIGRDVSAGRLEVDQLGSVLTQSTARLSFVTDELQNASLNTRMVPIDMVFKKIPRIVRDLAASLHKEVDLIIEGKETEIDKTMIEQFGDPLVHLIRNCLDHGLESPEIRVKNGKPASGTLKVDARQEGDQIVVSIVDDGRGIDPERVTAKAIERGLITAEGARNMSRREILDLIFRPGFSTVDVATNVSGRGVGMDVVRTNLKKLNGTVEVESVVGKGTTVVLRVPLTMAILPVLLVRVVDEVYGVPLRSVLEILRIPPSDIHRIEGQEVLSLQDRTLPLVRLASVLAVPGESPNGEMLRVVIMVTGETRFALLVDSLLGQESTVIKPMESLLRDCTSIAGATISGDGRVRLVLDPAGLVNSVTELGVQ